MDTGELITRWTARAALLLYAGSLLVRGLEDNRRDRLHLSRWLWTAGCLVFLAHVVCAFEFVHHWSHSAAYAYTARQSAEITGRNWGGGLYLNYLFTLIWLADTGWWWLSAKSYESRPRWIDWPVPAFLAFMAFNATVGFAAGLTRW